eukprot:CAMPEP_0205855106 /NCGR_PEP_ID=MMETSP1083-20121108/2431_1 /ASSEMBLY_ACC=CAM_ASM_000430 /TAXON_ID=97485 /ORGANISM="Prymnesium parvum, Strain Texoma1" /LENGTH=82 /DNA_ID=CAMNT_0053216465 /DNA_START=465 /DNA_END=709 /DNA_ORIENTATION=-
MPPPCCHMARRETPPICPVELTLSLRQEESQAVEVAFLRRHNAWRGSVMVVLDVIHVGCTSDQLGDQQRVPVGPATGAATTA